MPREIASRTTVLEGMTAAILAGGLGTRLRPTVGDRPKCLAAVHGRPFLTILLDQLTAVSIPRVVLLTGYMADMVSRTLGDTYAGMQLVYSPEATPLGTGELSVAPFASCVARTFCS